MVSCWYVHVCDVELIAGGFRSSHAVLPKMDRKEVIGKRGIFDWIDHPCTFILLNRMQCNTKSKLSSIEAVFKSGSEIRGLFITQIYDGTHS